MTQFSSSPQPANEETLRAWLHLSNCQFSPKMLANLLQRFDNSPNALLNATEAEWEETPGWQPRYATRLRDPAAKPSERQWTWLLNQNVTILTLTSPHYPERLREIPDPPPILFAYGIWETAETNAVAFVGSRASSPYGRATAEKFARELSQHGVTVVSGGAAGIDTAVHRGAVSGDGRTVAVLGCGVDIDYPQENHSLFKQVIQKGALLSEYSLGSKPEPWRFPQRNRIISGMSLGTLVVEAPSQSGALITARYAVEQGRTVMTIPANIDRPSSVGSNELLKEGAFPILCVEDILHALRLIAVPTNKAKQTALSFEEETPLKTPPTTPDFSQLPPNQRTLAALLSLTPKHIDALAQEAQLDAMQIGVELTLMELAGVATRMPGNCYIRTA